MRSDYEVVRKRGLRIRSKDREHSRRESKRLPLDRRNRAVRFGHRGGESDLQRGAAAAHRAIVRREDNDPDFAKWTRERGVSRRRISGPERILGGLCFICLNRIEPGVIERYDNGRLTIGEFRGYPQPRLHDHRLGIQTLRRRLQCRRRISRCERWRKLVWNIPFNGLSVVAGGIDTARSWPTTVCGSSRSS